MLCFSQKFLSDAFLWIHDEILILASLTINLTINHYALLKARLNRVHPQRIHVVVWLVSPRIALFLAFNNIGFLRRISHLNLNWARFWHHVRLELSSVSDVSKHSRGALSGRIFGSIGVNIWCLRVAHSVWNKWGLLGVCCVHLPLECARWRWSHATNLVGIVGVGYRT